MDDDGSALCVGAKHKSFTDLECALKKVYNPLPHWLKLMPHNILF